MGFFSINVSTPEKFEQKGRIFQLKKDTLLHYWVDSWHTGIWTHNLLIMNGSLYHCATTSVRTEYKSFKQFKKDLALSGKLKQV